MVGIVFQFSWQQPLASTWSPGQVLVALLAPVPALFQLRKKFWDSGAFQHFTIVLQRPVSTGWRVHCKRMCWKQFQSPGYVWKEERGFHSIQTAPQPGRVVCSVPKFQAFLCIFLFMGRKFVCVGQIKVTVWYNQILGQDNQGPRPQDVHWYVPIAQLICHLVPSLLPGGDEGLDVICRNQAAPAVLTFLLFFSC